MGVVAGAQGFVAALVATTVAALIAAAEQLPEVAGEPLAAIGVDIPIGLVDGPSRGSDRAARAFVGPRRSSVFAAPHPSVVHLDDYAAVNRCLAELGFAKMSKQGFFLLPRIREVAGLAHDPRVVEVFPEASFRALAGHPITTTKKTWNGSAERRALLASADPAIVLPDDLGPAGLVPADDVLDAAAAAWSAWRIAQGTAEAHGDPEELDPATGRPIAFWV